MILKIAWRNIWRSRTRSFVVIGAITVGVWAVIALLGFSSGTVTSYINSIIKNELSHIQIHNSEFLDEKSVGLTITDPETVFTKVKNTKNVIAASQRVVVTGMVSSSKGGRGVMIVGIDPEEESNVTGLNTTIKEGDYFSKKKKNQILISQRMAEKLQVKMRQKVVLNFQNKDSDMTAGAFRVAGIFSTGSNNFDEFRVFTRRSDMNRLLGEENMAHEIALLVDDLENVPVATENIKIALPDLDVKTYKEISPEVNLFESQMQVSAIIFMFIIMLALIFGIINTMLMAVLERYRELGMLMSIGMNKAKIFWMIVFETIMLGTIATPIGLLLGWATIKRLNKTGIDLSAYSEGMKEFGMSEIIYPNLQSEYYIQLALAVAITAVLASLYPAYKAVKLKPVEAIRKL